EVTFCHVDIDERGPVAERCDEGDERIDVGGRVDGWLALGLAVRRRRGHASGRELKVGAGSAGGEQRGTAHFTIGRGHSLPAGAMATRTSGEVDVATTRDRVGLR